MSSYVILCGVLRIFNSCSINCHSSLYKHSIYTWVSLIYLWMFPLSYDAKHVELCSFCELKLKFPQNTPPTQNTLSITGQFVAPPSPYQSIISHQTSSITGWVHYEYVHPFKTLFSFNTFSHTPMFHTPCRERRGRGSPTIIVVPHYTKTSQPWWLHVYRDQRPLYNILRD